jgi:predicted outer membrane repeat protein
MAKRQRRRRHERRRKHSEGSEGRSWPTRRSVITGAGLTAGAVLGMSSVAQGADYYVDQNDDPGASGCTYADHDDCSLRGAITKANATIATDYVLFESGVTGTITLGSEIPITNPVGIYGPGPSALTVSGDNNSRIFNIDMADAGQTVAITGLTLADGMVTGDGGAILNLDATLGVYFSVLTGNTASGAGSDGGAIYDKGDDPYDGNYNRVLFTTLDDNTAGDDGGAIYAFDSLGLIGTSTLTGNTAADQGGGAYGYFYGYAYNSTFSGNTGPGGGAIYNHDSVGLVNTIAANTSGGLADVSSKYDVRAGFSLIENAGDASLVDATYVPGPNILGQDPQLGGLGDNGGITPTMKPAATSPVVDQGRSFSSSDQRLVDRPVDIPSVPNAPGGDGGDIGSIELTLAEGPQPPPGPAPLPGPTFNLKKAIKKCKKKFPKGPKRKRCIRKAKRKASVSAVRGIAARSEGREGIQRLHALARSEKDRRR